MNFFFESLILISAKKNVSFSMSTREYEVFNLDTSMPLEAMEAATSLNVAEPSVMLGCCRFKILSPKESLSNPKYFFIYFIFYCLL